MVDLVNLDEYKTYKGITSSEKDSKIIQIIGNASGIIKEYCNRTLVDHYDTDKVEYYDGTCQNTIYPNELPIVSITSLEQSIDGGETFTAQISGEDYFWNRIDDSILTGTAYTFVSAYYNPANSLRLTYKGGYLDIPEDLKIACFDLIHYYSEGEYTPKRVMSGATQDNAQFRLMYTTNFPPHIQRVLDLYRIVF